MKTFLLPLFVLISFACLAQNAAEFDISQYKARYERRPFLEMGNNLSFRGTFDSNQDDQTLTQLRNLIRGSIQKNTDAIQSVITFNGAFNYDHFSGPSNRVSDGIIGLRTSVRKEQLNFSDNNRFWGYSYGGRINLRFGIAQSRDLQQEVGASGGISFGQGRLEFAEDAILGNFMVNDLRDAGVFSNIGAREAGALALTITDIIGNRTFDFRRRRIYELQRLNKTVESLGLDAVDQFMLFAVLNDNWAFANRLFIRHGSQRRFGFELDNQLEFTRDFGVHNGSFFAEYTKAKIINNNGNLEWSVRGSLGIVKNDLVFDQFDFGNGFYPGASATVTRSLLPNSRSSLVFGAGGQVSLTLAELTEDNSDSSIRTNVNTNFQYRYFINYQWAMEFSAGFQAVHNTLNEDTQFFPNLGIRSQYNFF